MWLATDYLSSENAASPVQHYWSLSVEEQFYLVWPILIMAGVIIARRLDWSLRFTLAVALSATFAASLTCSIILTASEPEGAYFLLPVSGSWLWEVCSPYARDFGALGRHYARSRVSRGWPP